MMVFAPFQAKALMHAGQSWIIAGRIGIMIDFIAPDTDIAQKVVIKATQLRPYAIPGAACAPRPCN